MSPTPPTRKPARPAPAPGRKPTTTSSTSSSRRLPIAIIVGAVVAIGLIVAIVLLMGTEKPTDVQACLALRTQEGVAAAVAERVCNNPEVGSPVVTGDALPSFERVGSDPGLGLTIPQVAGQDFAGNPVSITLDGRPKVIMFFAHWCSVCRQELPLLAQWLPGATLPENLELITVATGVDITRANYPTSAWMQSVGWTVPVILDDAGDSVLNAFGISAFPGFVFVNADGRVFLRWTGLLPTADLQTIIASLIGS